jgi:hypothetical protein
MRDHDNNIFDPSATVTASLAIDGAEQPAELPAAGIFEADPLDAGAQPADYEDSPDQHHPPEHAAFAAEAHARTRPRTLRGEPRRKRRRAVLIPSWARKLTVSLGVALLAFMVSSIAVGLLHHSARQPVPAPLSGPVAQPSPSRPRSVPSRHVVRPRPRPRVRAHRRATPRRHYTPPVSAAHAQPSPLAASAPSLAAPTYPQTVYQPAAPGASASEFSFER